MSNDATITDLQKRLDERNQHIDRLENEQRLLTDRHDVLNRQVKHLQKLLLESLEWNWMQEDAPDTAPYMAAIEAPIGQPPIAAKEENR